MNKYDKTKRKNPNANKSFKIDKNTGDNSAINLMYPMSQIDVRKTLKRRNSYQNEQKRSRKMLRKYPKVTVGGAYSSNTLGDKLPNRNKNRSRKSSISKKRHHQSSDRLGVGKANKSTQKFEMVNK